MAIDRQRALAAIGEPTRFRILQLLAEGPRTVGEVAAALGALQPQTTKHLQALEAAGVIRVHPLGRRRVASLDREAMAELAEHFAGWAAASAEASDDRATLERYASAVVGAESALAGGGLRRRLLFTRVLAADAPTVWTAWTRADVAARWWAPRHFTVTAYTLDASPGGAVRLALREADGATHESAGRVVSATAPRGLVFDLAPVGPDGTALFAARHTLELEGAGPTTTLRLVIDVAADRPEAAAAVAGLEPGWDQLLDQLAAQLRR